MKRRRGSIVKCTGKSPVSRETYHKTPRLPPRPTPRKATRRAHRTGKLDGERSDGIEHSAWDGTERPSRSDSDCGDARYAPKNIEKTGWNDAGDARKAMTERPRRTKTTAGRPARRLVERVEGRDEAIRNMERLRNRQEREGIGELAGIGTGWDAAIIEEKQVAVERAGSADVVLSDKDPTLRGNYPHFYEDKNGELNIYIIK